MPVPDRPTSLTTPIVPALLVVRSRDGILILWAHPHTGDILSAHGIPYN